MEEEAEASLADQVGRTTASHVVGAEATWAVGEGVNPVYRGEQGEEGVDHPYIVAGQRPCLGPSAKSALHVSYSNAQTYLSLVPDARGFPSLLLHLAIALFSLTLFFLPAQLEVRPVSRSLAVPISRVRSMRLARPISVSVPFFSLTSPSSPLFPLFLRLVPIMVSPTPLPPFVITALVVVVVTMPV